MEKKLSSMFEFQRFAPNARLTRMIEETESRYANELEDADLWMVNAAGSPEAYLPEEVRNNNKEES